METADKVEPVNVNINDAFDYIKKYNKLQSENYMLKGEIEKYKKYKRIIHDLQRENKELEERIREHTLLISPYYVKENFIPVQKIKDKIKSNKEIINKTNDGNLIHALNEENKVLQELLEERRK